jgi:hypothetical protein
MFPNARRAQHENRRRSAVIAELAQFAARLAHGAAAQYVAIRSSGRMDENASHDGY